jgi:uncharacterized cupin superfamily protein
MAIGGRKQDMCPYGFIEEGGRRSTATATAMSGMAHGRRATMAPEDDSPMPKIDPDRAPRASGSRYPVPFDEPCRGRSLLRLGEAAGLTQFGVNLVRLAPGAWSSQRHWHKLEDELVYVVEGELTLVTDAGEETMRAGESAGFKGGVRDGHHLQNRTSSDAVFLVVGSRIEGDEGDYSDLDMRFTEKGFVHKDGTPY